MSLASSFNFQERAAYCTKLYVVNALSFFALTLAVLCRMV